MTETNLLKEKIKDNGYTLQYVASTIGITYAGLQKKLNNETEFKQTEIQTLRKLLQLSPEDCDAIFFAQKVD